MFCRHSATDQGPPRARTHSTSICCILSYSQACSDMQPRAHAHTQINVKVDLRELCWGLNSFLFSRRPVASVSFFCSSRGRLSEHIHLPRCDLCTQQKHTPPKYSGLLCGTQSVHSKCNTFRILRNSIVKITGIEKLIVKLCKNFSLKVCPNPTTTSVSVIYTKLYLNRENDKGNHLFSLKMILIQLYKKYVHKITFTKSITSLL